MIPLEKVASILGHRIERRLPITSFVIDSRQVKPGSLFFAYKGEKVDGHSFLPEVAEKGAFAAVVSEGYKGPSYGMELIYVKDVKESLHDLAKTIHQERKTRVIGITGSVGKTTTKEFIATLLEKKFRIYKTPGSCNSQMTLPLAILGAKGNEQYLVLEMGMTHRGNIANLVKIAPPEIVVLGPIVIGHSAFHEDLESIARAKCEIFTSHAEFAVIHEISAQQKTVIDSCNCPNVVYPTDIGIKSPFVESHLTENFIGACEVALHLGMTKMEIQNRISYLKPFQRRFEKIRHQGVLYIDDSYNANPTSTIAALMNLPEPKKGGRRIFAFGSMKELGKFCFESHSQVGLLAAEKVDELLCIGEEAKPMIACFSNRSKGARQFSCYQEMKRALQEMVKEGDVVLIKGSNSHKLWELIDHIDRGES